MSSRLTWLSMLCATLAFAGPTPKKPSKKKAPPPPVASVEVTRALDDHQAAVGGCVVDAAAPGTKWTQVVKVKLVLNSAGQVFSLDLALDPATDKAGQVKECIDKALRAGTWPKVASPMVTAEREWTFAMQ
jgi:hypothetical protein